MDDGGSDADNRNYCNHRRHSDENYFYQRVFDTLTVLDAI